MLLPTMPAPITTTSARAGTAPMPDLLHPRCCDVPAEDTATSTRAVARALTAGEAGRILALRRVRL